MPYTEFDVHVAPSAGGGTTVTIYGELDVATADRVAAAFDEALRTDGPVDCDLRACGFVDSRGIATLIGAALKLRDQGRELVLHGVQPRVERILRIAGISESEFITVEPQED